ncbi:MAG: helix-turn-helix domain-containing protein [Oscillospiraceae bacterium]|nr:helix-turn-helix domain-containing protein [Oscillospiraceae bacterium]
MKPAEANSTIFSERGMFLTVTDMAELLKVSRFVIDRMLKSGQLPAAKLGGQYRVRTDDFLKWWDQQVKQEQKNILRGCLK